jgi:hypothetical protein
MKGCETANRATPELLIVGERHWAIAENEGTNWTCDLWGAFPVSGRVRLEKVVATKFDASAVHTLAIIALRVDCTTEECHVDDVNATGNA